MLNDDGDPIKSKNSLKYLNVILRKKGRIDSEIASKIGNTKSEFRSLVQIWKHANIPVGRKIQLYKSLILTRLLHDLQTVWLSKHLRQRIDGFHCMCLRQILGIAHPYISRISNAIVLLKVSQRPLHRQLLRESFIFYGRIMRSPTC